MTDDKLGPPSLTMAFIRAGETVFLGSDTGGMPRIPGFSNIHSLKLLYTNYGFDPVEAIRIATHEGARFLRTERTGTIATHKEADLVVVTGASSEEAGAGVNPSPVNPSAWKRMGTWTRISNPSLTSS